MIHIRISNVVVTAQCDIFNVQFHLYSPRQLYTLKPSGYSTSCNKSMHINTYIHNKRGGDCIMAQQPRCSSQQVQVYFDQMIFPVVRVQKYQVCLSFSDLSFSLKVAVSAYI